MSDIAILKEMIKDTATVPLTKNNYGKNTVILEESNDYSVTINGMPDNEQVIVIKTDAFKARRFANYSDYNAFQVSEAQEKVSDTITLYSVRFPWVNPTYWRGTSV